MKAFTQAFAIGQVTIKNQPLWEAYKTALSVTLLLYKGEVLFRGQVSEVLSGTSTHTDVVLIQFASIEDLNTWFNSAEYQEIIALRDMAADVNLTSYAP